MRTTRLLIALASAAALSVSAEEFTLDGLRYSVSDHTHATVLGLADAATQSVFIPYTVNYSDNGEEHMFFVTAIAAYAFAGTGITRVVFEPPAYSGAASQGALIIGDGAFNTPTLMAVNTFRPHLPEVEGDPFNAETYAKGTLGFGINLTEDQIEAYKTTEPWSRFIRSETTAADIPSADPSASVTGVYTTSGIKVCDGTPDTSSLAPGVYVVRTGQTATLVRL